MKLSRREKKLLTFLAFILILFSYYYFSFRILEGNLETATIQLEDLESQKQIQVAKMATNKRLDEDLANLKAEIIGESSRYYDKIDQEEALMVLVKFAKKASLDLLNLEFIPVASEDGFRDKVTASVSFNSDYKSIKTFMKSIEENDKLIKVSNTSFVGSSEGTIKGILNLEFNELNKNLAFVPYENAEVTLQDNYKNAEIDPFVPIESLIPSSEMQDENVDILIQEEDSDFLPKTLVYGFEEGNTFFVGNSEQVFGVTGRSETRKENAYATYLEFDFINDRVYNEASVVFDGAPITLEKQVDTIDMWVYAYQSSDQNIGLVVLDSAGKEYKLQLTKGVYWTQWQEINAKMPLDITYPCVIQRIYVESIGYGHKLNGKYLFDQLEVTYPIQ